MQPFFPLMPEHDGQTWQRLWSLDTKTWLPGCLRPAGDGDAGQQHAPPAETNTNTLALCSKQLGATGGWGISAIKVWQLIFYLTSTSMHESVVLTDCIWILQGFVFLLSICYFYCIIYQPQDKLCVEILNWHAGSLCSGVKCSRVFHTDAPPGHSPHHFLRWWAPFPADDSGVSRTITLFSTHACSWACAEPKQSDKSHLLFTVFFRSSSSSGLSDLLRTPTRKTHGLDKHAQLVILLYSKVVMLRGS